MDEGSNPDRKNDVRQFVGGLVQFVLGPRQRRCLHGTGERHRHIKTENDDAKDQCCAAAK